MTRDGDRCKILTLGREGCGCKTCRRELAAGYGLCDYCSGLYVPGDHVVQDQNGTVHELCAGKEKRS